MATFVRIRQDKQARNSDNYDDQKPSGPVMESAPINLEEDLNNIRSQLRRIVDASGNWFDNPNVDLQIISDQIRYFRQPLIGTIDGVNTVFTVPGVAKFKHGGFHNEEVFMNGLLQSDGFGMDYEASESGGPGTGYDTITFSEPPKPGDVLAINFTLF